MTNKNITSEEVKKIASLARIELSEKEEQKFSKELGSILDFFDNICQVNVNNVEKFDHYQLKENQVRKDKVVQATEVESGLIKKNFPNRKEDYLSVKVVLGK